MKKMARHRKDFKDYLEGKRHYVSVFEIFEEYGIEHCRIIWIEDCACNSKKELEAREGELQKENVCVNKHRAGRTRQQYCIDNSAMLSEKRKARYQENREELLEKNKRYRRENKEKINEKRKPIMKKTEMCIVKETESNMKKERHEQKRKIM